MPTKKPTVRKIYTVVVGNIGLVHEGVVLRTAKKEYNEYVQRSTSGTGRAGNEVVTLFCDGEPVKGCEHNPETSKRKATWFVVVNNQDEVLGVFGESLEEQAWALTKELRNKFPFGVCLLVTHMARPALRTVIPPKHIVKEVLLYLPGQVVESEVHPNSLGQLREQGGQWAAYRNESIGHPCQGQLKYLKFGEGCTCKEAPRPRLPDTNTAINWAYQYYGLVDVTTGLIKKEEKLGPGGKQDE